MPPVRKSRNALALLGEPRRNLLPGEDVRLYDDLRAELVARYEPETMLEELEIDHLLHTLWEVRRNMAIKPQVLNMERKRALAELVKDILSPGLMSGKSIDEADTLADGYFGNEAERKKTEDLLARYGLDDRSIVAKAFVLNADALEGLEHQIHIATGRAYAIKTKLEDMRRERKADRRKTSKATKVALALAGKQGGKH